MLDYKTTGVDIDAGNNFVNDIKEIVKSTHRPEVLGGFGGFNGMMRIPSGYDNPILVSGTDGVGNKSYLTSLFATGNPDIMKDVGQDLVAMCVNDVITCGAEPLYFLDYIKCNKLRPELLKPLVEGIGDACKEAGCTLLGGETAEHGERMGDPDHLELAGFCTGVVEERDIIDGRDIKKGDKIIGISSSGLHCNGFSMVRYLTFRHKIILKENPEILAPTRIYSRLVKTLIDNIPVLGMANITGGGLVENLPRCLPEGLRAEVDYTSWKRPEIFNVIQNAGEIEEEEMKRVFNLGIGYCLVVPPDVVQDTLYVLRAYDSLIEAFDSFVIGEIQ